MTFSCSIPLFTFPSGEVALRLPDRRTLVAARRRRALARACQRWRTGRCTHVKCLQKRDEGERPSTVGETTVGDVLGVNRNTMIGNMDKKEGTVVPDRDHCSDELWSGCHCFLCFAFPPGYVRLSGRFVRWCEALVLGKSVGAPGSSDEGNARDDASNNTPDAPPGYKMEKEGPAPVQRERCTKEISLRRKARVVVSFLRKEYGLERARPLPPRIRCGHLRSAIRSTYPEVLTPLLELVIKTSQKLEKRVCSFCKSEDYEIIRKWKEDRFEQPEVDDEHRRLFEKALRCNVAWGWNRRKYAYVPNGHRTAEHSVLEGGNWNEEPISTDVCLILVWSSGKPRIVTCYPSGNTAQLYSPHHSLYSSLQKGRWLLVGSPTNEDVERLNGLGEYVSVDYSSATDRLKCAYVRTAVEVLKDKADPPLDDETVRCLNILASPDFGLGGCGTGQPMGSMMSFPLLCLFNKTVVDLALRTLVDKGEVSDMEYRTHRCLINGDDLLFREPRSGSLLYDAVAYHGAQVGFKLNREKTMRHPELAEINSTLFCRGKKVKKTNLAALYMGDVSDVVGFAADSAVSRKAFSFFVSRNLLALARQPVKIQGPIPLSFKGVLFGRKFQDALTTLYSVQTKANMFPIVTRPAGYDLTLDEEHEIVGRRVQYVRERGLWRELLSKVPPPTRIASQSRAKALSPRKNQPDDNILACLAKGWERKEREKLQSNEIGAEPGWCLVYDGPRAFGLCDAIRSFHALRTCGQRKTPYGLYGGETSDAVLKLYD